MKNERGIWAACMIVCLIVSVIATIKGGYVGPDYSTHLGRFMSLTEVFDFSTTSPPLYYLLGFGFLKLIGHHNGFPITLSVFQILLNLLSLWYFLIFTRPFFKSSLLHLSFSIFLIFLPVRMIHSATIGTDCTTIPCFALLLFYARKYFEKPNPGVTDEVALGLALGFSVFCKYSFMALIPAAFALIIFMARFRKWSLLIFVRSALLTLFLASALSLYSFWASYQVHGYNTSKHWLHNGAMPDMDFHDLLTVKSQDLDLFRAPEYFKREILVGHRHSYLGLVHLGIFTDTMNLFQVLPVPQDVDHYLGPEQKTRSSSRTPFMIFAMSLGVLWTLLGFAGGAKMVGKTMLRLWRGEINFEVVFTAFGICYFLLMFLPIPFVYGGDLYGYWTPRLILPPLLWFFFSGFLLCEDAQSEISKGAAAGPVAKTETIISKLIFTLVCVQSLAQLCFLFSIV